MKISKLLIFVLFNQLIACASGNIAQNLSMITFDEKASGDNIKSIGNVEGKDCTWYVMGYAIGEAPTVRNAFLNAMERREANLIPGQKAAIKGDPLKAVKNVSVENSGFNAYVASRACVVVTGVGLK